MSVWDWVLLGVPGIAVLGFLIYTYVAGDRWLDSLDTKERE